jgi:hypothetical protein
MFGYTTTITTVLILRIARGRRFMGDLFMGDRLITGITGRDIVRRRLGIDRMGRTSRDIVRRRIMVDVRLIQGTEEGRPEMVEVHDRLGMEMAGIGLGMGTGLVLLGTEMEAAGIAREMAVGLDRPETAGILGMGEERAPLAMVAGLGRLGMVEAAGRLSRPVPLRRPDRLRHRGRHRRLVLLQRLLIGQPLDLRLEGLIPGIRRVVRGLRNGLSRRLVRGRVDLGEITMAQRRGRRVIAARRALVVGVREGNRNDFFQA